MHKLGRTTVSLPACPTVLHIHLAFLASALPDSAALRFLVSAAFLAAADLSALGRAAAHERRQSSYAHAFA